MLYVANQFIEWLNTLQYRVYIASEGLGHCGISGDHDEVYLQDRSNCHITLLYRLLSRSGEL